VPEAALSNKRWTPWTNTRTVKMSNDSFLDWRADPSVIDEALPKPGNPEYVSRANGSSAAVFGPGPKATEMPEAGNESVTAIEGRDVPLSREAQARGPAAAMIPAPGAKPTSTLAFLVNQAIQHGVEACYSQKLAMEFARAQILGDAEAKAEAITLENKLKERFGKELNLTRLRAIIKAFREDLRAELLPHGGQYLITNAGTLRPCVANAIAMVRQLPLRYDAFACRTTISGETPWGSTGMWTDVDDIKATEWCQRLGLHVTSTLPVHDAVEAVARERSFHPVLQYFESLTWDGVERLDTWLTQYLGVPDTPYAREVGAKWMISAVARVKTPGCQADHTLVLEGPQGKRKSTALRIVGGQFFTDDVADIGTKDSALQLQGKLIVELAEMDAFKCAEVTTINAWLTRREDNFRPPYGHRTQNFPRQNIFCASTNKTKWGKDPTGLRRFWPVRVGAIDLAALERDRDQLWAEAYARAIAGETWWLDNEDSIKRAEAEQRERYGGRPLDNRINEFLRRSGRDSAMMDEILAECIVKKKESETSDKTEKNSVRSAQTQVGKALKRLGWKRHRLSKKPGKKQRYRYLRPKE
jgi:hypothetical protein